MRPGFARLPAACLAALLSAFAAAQVPAKAEAPAKADAEPRFRFPAEGRIVAGPEVSAGRVWFMTDARLLFVLTEDGTAVARVPWTAPKGAVIVCDAFGRALVSAGTGEYALVNRAGQVVVKVRPGPSPQGKPVFGADGRFFLAANGTVRAYAASGHPLWSAEAGGAVTLLAPGPGGGVLAATGSSLRLYDMYGRTLLERPTDSPVDCAAASPDGSLAAGLRDGSLLIWPAPVGSSQARRADPGFAASALAGCDGAWFVAGPGRLAAFDLEADPLWSIPTEARGELRVLAFREREVLLWKDRASSLDREGVPFRELRIRNAEGFPAFGPAGAVFSGGLDWILYSYAFERALDPALPEPGAPASDEAFAAAVEAEALWSPEGATEDGILEALAAIEKAVGSGTIGADEERATAYCCGIALGFAEAPFGAGPVAPGPNPKGPLPRERACDILGTLGSPAAVGPLARVFGRDADQSVRAAAARAIARIGLDPGGRAFAAFEATPSRALDGRTASALAECIERLYRANGTLDDGRGIATLLRISGGPFTYAVRKKAEAALSRVTARQ